MLNKYLQHVKQLTEFDFLQMFEGISQGAKDKGIDLTPEDITQINFWEQIRQTPKQSSACTNMAVWGNATSNGKTIVGCNFDFPWCDSLAYKVILVAFPKGKNAFISVPIAGMVNNNFTMNNKGLVFLSNKGPNERPEDLGFGVNDFLMGAYVSMTSTKADQGMSAILNSQRTDGNCRLIADKQGNAFALETTAELSAFRSPGDYEEQDYLITANHFIILYGQNIILTGNLIIENFTRDLYPNFHL
jgi:hypothetical protein